jgi:predicted amino acid dehydrogenase
MGYPAGNVKLAESVQIVSAIEPCDLNASATTSDIVCLKNYQECAIIIHGAVGTATSGDLTVTVEQMTDVSNSLSDNKALNFVRYDIKQGLDLAAIGTFTKTTQTASNTFTNATSGETEQIYVISFHAEDLDIANDFDCVRFTLSATSSSKIVSALFVLSGPKFGVDPELTAIAD